MLSRLDQDILLLRRIDAGMRETAGIEGLETSLADDDLNLARVQYRGPPDIHADAGEHQSGHGEAAIGDAAHGARPLDRVPSQFHRRLVDLASELESDLPADHGCDHLRNGLRIG